MSIFIPLTEPERDELLRLIASGEPLPEGWRGRLFPDSPHAIEIGKEYQLVYEGKARREEVLAETPAAPWQLVRRFCADRPFEDGWRKLLVWGDNLLALRELRADQRGPDRLGTRGKIKLIYIDPPFATRQDFMKDILEVENTLSWGYEPSRAQYRFPLHNLRYQPEQTTVEVKREQRASRRSRSSRRRAPPPSTADSRRRDCWRWRSAITTFTISKLLWP